MNFRSQMRKPHERRTQSVLRWGRYFFFAVGILSLGYAGYALVDARVYQAYETWRFERALKSVKPAAGGVELQHPSPLPALAKADRARVESPPPKGSLVGRIEISSIGLAAMIEEGDGGRTLRQAVGHIPGTALPGEPGNVVLAGHRDTFFRPLRNIRKGDEIILVTLDGSFRYRVDLTEVLLPKAIEVLGRSACPILTLVTCYPFYFVGPAPKRFIVRASKMP